ncbi:MAG: hypothetical protein AB7P20_05705 [Rhizobiaceae bacterium]
MTTEPDPDDPHDGEMSLFTMVIISVGIGLALYGIGYLLMGLL